jgi:hypothetical protein
MNSSFISRLGDAIAPTRAWIESYVQKHSHLSRSVSSLGIAALSFCYPEELLQQTRVVFVETIVYPPMARFGLPELAGQEQMQFDGITFDNTYFLRQGLERESLHFHELVHVIQWQRLGVERFLLAYGIGLAQFGYENGPLEKWPTTCSGSSNTVSTDDNWFRTSRSAPTEFGQTPRVT